MSVGIRLARGKKGAQGPAGGTSGRSYYFAYSTASDIGGAYKVAQLTPSGSAESTVATANTGTGYTLAATFATLSGEPGVLSLPLGSAFHLLYASVDGGVANVKLDIYKRVLAGTETLLRSGTTSNFTNLSSASIDEVYTDASADALLVTDRLIFKFYVARVSGPATVTTTLYFEGNLHASQVQTTITVSTLAGDVTGDTANTLVVKAYGVAFDSAIAAAGAAQDGHILTYDSFSDHLRLASPTVGSSGPAGPPGGSAGRRYYLDLATASSIGGAYKVASLTPATTAETSVTHANTGTGDTLVATFATIVGQPGTLELPLGTATRFIYAKVDAGANAIGRLKVDLYKRAAGGTETLLRTGHSQSVTDTIPTLIQWQFTDANGYILLADDRIVFKIYTARVSGGTANTVSMTLYFAGNDYASSIETTILNTTTTGGLIRTVGAVKTTTYQCLTTDYDIPTDCTGSSFTVTLLASPEVGREFTIHDSVGLCGTPYRVTISGGAKNINGFGTSLVMASPFFSMTFRYNGVIWNITDVY